MLDLRLKKCKHSWLRWGCARCTSSIFNRTSHIPSRTSHVPRGISLIEILISMFVMLFGLMGVAAIFPVANHYVVEGEKFDLGSAIAQNAFEELGARGMLKPGEWMYPTEYTQPFPTVALKFTSPGTTEIFHYHFPASDGPGNVIVIDPLGGSAPVDPATPNYATQKTFFPFTDYSKSNLWDSTINTGYDGRKLLVDDGIWPPYNPTEWPVRRVTLPVPNPPGSGLTGSTVMMTPEIAETIFRLRDDLAVDQPDESDVPSIQRWDVDGGNLLRRQYKGDYSWLATVVPTTGEALAALQPAHEAYGEINYDVSVVVFRKRDTTPSAESERLIEAELLQGGELVLFDRNNVKQNVDDAVEDIRPGNWIAVMGVNQTTGDFLMKWYRILSLDDETTPIFVNTTGQNQEARGAMLIGPDWPDNSMKDLRAAILPGAFLVVTKPMKMEDSSLWSLE